MSKATMIQLYLPQVSVTVRGFLWDDGGRSLEMGDTTIFGTHRLILVRDLLNQLIGDEEEE